MASANTSSTGRMSTCPPASAKGQLDEFLGNDFGPQETSTKHGRGGGRSLNGMTTGKGKEKTGGNGARKPGRGLDESIKNDLDLDFDELDSISPAKSQWTKASHNLKAAWTGAAAINGQRHEGSSSYPVKKVLLPNFKKNKPKDDISTGVATPPPFNPYTRETLIDGQTYRYPPEIKAERPLSPKQNRPPPPSSVYSSTKGSETLYRPFKVPSSTRNSQASLSAPVASSSKQSLISVQDAAKSTPLIERNANEMTQQSLPLEKFPFGLSGDKDNNDETPRPNFRDVGAAAGAKPRKVRSRGLTSSPSSSHEKTPHATHRPQTRSVNRKLVSNSAIEDLRASSDEERSTGKTKAFAALRPFPMQEISPVKSTAKSSVKSTKGLGKSTKNVLPSAPHESQSSGICKSSRAKGRRVVLSDEQSEDERMQVPAIRAFPMDSQLLESIDHFHSPGKRASEGSDPGDTSRSQRKRLRRDYNEVLPDESIPQTFDSELHFFDPRTDPSTLCPWCDEPLPPTPSPLLTSLIATLRRNSTRDPRPTNPEGLWASPTQYAHVCARHAFEDQHIPMAQAHGWPTRIEWSALGKRIGRFKRQLQAIIDDEDEDYATSRSKSEDHVECSQDTRDTPDDEDEILRLGRPRKGSVFWRDIVRNVKMQGSKRALGVRGQFSNFAKTQPGYYGELGYVIIHQVIYDLFPPSYFRAESTLPLMPSEFIQLVLIPEAAVALIMEDMSQPRKASIKILRESAEYGVAMFPDEGGFNVGENIVRQRAKNRRRELGDEDAGNDSDSESAAMFEVSTVPITKAQGKRRGRPRKTPQSVVAESSDGEGDMTSNSRVRQAASSGPKKSKKLEKKPSQPQDYIMISSSSESVGQPEPAPNRPKPRPTRKPRPKPASTSSLRMDDFVPSDLCQSDISDSLAFTLHSTSQPHNLMSSSEKENVCRTSDSEIDLDSDSHNTPPSSLTLREVTWDPHGQHHFKERSSSVVPSSDVDETPKSRRTFTRTNSASSTTAVVGPSIGTGVFPPGMTRKRPRNNLIIEKPTRKSTSDDQWLTSLKDSLSEYDSAA